MHNGIALQAVMRDTGEGITITIALQGFQDAIHRHQIFHPINKALTKVQN